MNSIVEYSQTFVKIHHLHAFVDTKPAHRCDSAELRRRDCAAGSTSMPAARAIFSQVESAGCWVYGDGETVVDGERAHARRCSAASSQVLVPQPPQKQQFSSIHFKQPTTEVTNKILAGLSVVNAHQSH